MCLTYSKWIAVIFLVFHIGASVVVAQESDPYWHEIEMDGKNALLEKDYERAYRSFNKGLNDADSLAENPWRSVFLFYLGLTRHQQYEDENEYSLLEDAARFYGSAIDIDSTLGSTYNNLAQVYEAMYQSRNDGVDDDELLSKIKSIYERLTQSDSENVVVYKLNYANHLMDLNAFDEALIQYKSILEVEPDHAEVQDSLISAYNKVDAQATFDYLWSLITARQSIRALRISLNQLQREGRGFEERLELLTIVSVCLSRLDYEHSEFASLDVYEEIIHLQFSELIGEGVSELIDLHYVDDPSAIKSFAWWSRFDTPFRSGISSLSGFRMLARSLGEWHQRNEQGRLAEYFYVTASSMNDEVVDGLLTLRLIEFYAFENRLMSMKKQLDHFELALTTGLLDDFREKRKEEMVQYSYLEELYYQTAFPTSILGDEECLEREEKSGVLIQEGHLDDAELLISACELNRPLAGKKKNRKFFVIGGGGLAAVVTGILLGSGGGGGGGPSPVYETLPTPPKVP